MAVSMLICERVLELDLIDRKQRTDAKREGQFHPSASGNRCCQCKQVGFVRMLDVFDSASTFLRHMFREILCPQNNCSERTRDKGCSWRKVASRFVKSREAGASLFAQQNELFTLRTHATDEAWVGLVGLGPLTEHSLTCEGFTETYVEIEPQNMMQALSCAVLMFLGGQLLQVDKFREDVCVCPLPHTWSLKGAAALGTRCVSTGGWVYSFTRRHQTLVASIRCCDEHLCACLGIRRRTVFTAVDTFLQVVRTRNSAVLCTSPGAESVLAWLGHRKSTPRIGRDGRALFVSGAASACSGAMSEQGHSEFHRHYRVPKCEVPWRSVFPL